MTKLLKQKLSNKTTISLLLAMIFTAVNFASVAEANFCAPASRSANQYSEVDNIIADISKLEKSFDLTKNRSANLQELKQIRARIESTIDKLAASQKIRLAPAINAYLVLLSNISTQAFKLRPQGVFSLRDLNAQYAISIKKADLMWVFPMSAFLPSDSQIFPGQAGRSRLGLSELNVLFTVFKGLGNQKAALSKAYTDTVKCMLSASVASQLSYTQALRGQINSFKLSNGAAKVCGQINLQQVFNAFQNSQVKDLVDAHNRKQLLAALPNYSAFQNAQFKKEMTELGLYEDNAFMAIYLGGTPATTTQPISDEVFSFVGTRVEQVINIANAPFGSVEDLVSFFQSPEFQSEVATLQNGCNRADPNFLLTLASAENLFLLQAYDQAVYSVVQDLSTLTDSNFNSVFTEILTRAKIISMSLALKSAMYIYGQGFETAEDIDLAVDRFTEKVIFTKVPARIAALQKQGQLNGFMNKVKTSYFAKVSGSQPMAQLRANYNTEIFNAAKKAQSYMTTKADKLPYKRDAILNAVTSEYNLLSPESQAVLDLVRSEEDFAKAKSYWQRLLGTVEKDLNNLSKNNPEVLAKKPSWYSLSGLSNLATSAYKGVKAWVSPSQERANKASAEVKKVAEEYKALVRIGAYLGFDRFNAEPKTFSSVLPAFYKDKSKKEGKVLEDSYREQVRRMAMGSYYILDMDYLGAKTYKVLAKLPSSAAASSVISSGLKESVTLQIQQLQKIAKVKRAADLSEYALKSGVIPGLLGAGDLSLHLGRQNIWPETRASFYSGPYKTQGTFVMPHLLHFHNKYVDELLKNEIFRSKLWEDTFSNANTVFLGLFGAWGTREVITRWFRVPGFTHLASAIRTNANFTRAIVTDYYQKLMGIIFLQLGYDVYTERKSSRELKALDQMYFSNTNTKVLADMYKENSLSRPSLWVPLLDENNYFAQKEATEQMQKNARIGVVAGSAAFALPFIFNYTRLGGYFADLSSGRAAARQKAMDKAVAAGNVTKADAIRQNFQNNTASFFQRRRADLILEFRALGLPSGTWSIKRLQTALEQIKLTNPKNLPRAQEAYKNIIATIGSRYLPAQNSEALKRSVINAIWKSEDEAYLFVKEYDRLFARQGRGA